MSKNIFSNSVLIVAHIKVKKKGETKPDNRYGELGSCSCIKILQRKSKMIKGLQIPPFLTYILEFLVFVFRMFESHAKLLVTNTFQLLLHLYNLDRAPS